MYHVFAFKAIPLRFGKPTNVWLLVEMESPYFNSICSKYSYSVPACLRHNSPVTFCFPVRLPCTLGVDLKWKLHYLIQIVRSLLDFQPVLFFLCIDMFCLCVMNPLTRVARVFPPALALGFTITEKSDVPNWLHWRQVPDISLRFLLVFILHNWVISHKHTSLVKFFEVW